MQIKLWYNIKKYHNYDKPIQKSSMFYRHTFWTKI